MSLGKINDQNKEFQRQKGWEMGDSVQRHHILSSVAYDYNPIGPIIRDLWPQSKRMTRWQRASLPIHHHPTPSRPPEKPQLSKCGREKGDGGICKRAIMEPKSHSAETQQRSRRKEEHGDGQKDTQEDGQRKTRRRRQQRHYTSDALVMVMRLLWRRLCSSFY